jgi:hypothetical protein
MDTLIYVVVIAVTLVIGFKMFTKKSMNTTPDFPVTGGGTPLDEFSGHENPVDVPPKI